MTLAGTTLRKPRVDLSKRDRVLSTSKVRLSFRVQTHQTYDQFLVPPPFVSVKLRESQLVHPTHGEYILLAAALRLERS